ncbi:MAG: rhodanese-like domain-containing protein [Actinomycetota bacterium]|jgi:rhodanese-related sulfurtransferase|nr:rhodanese-like domain-containing protein [Actinomycetota bacterium]
MDPRTLHERQTELQLLDVREDDEWAAGHVDGSRHIPLKELAARLHELDRTAPVITICRSGGRAGRAAELLAAQGLTAEVLDGGLQQWERERLPLRTADGRPGQLA